MAEAVVSLVLRTIPDLLIGEAKFLGGFSEHVEELEAELERMKSFLKDADAREHEGERVQTWVRQIRNLAYRAQDVLESFAVEGTSEKVVGIKKPFHKIYFMLTQCINIHKNGKDITTISKRIANLRESLQSYGINSTSEAGRAKEASEKQNLLRKTFAHEEEQDFVGMDDDIKELVSYVMDESKDSHRVISICGMGGSGKTTMARKIYNHKDVKQTFRGSAWICVTQKCETMAILKDLLKQLSGAGGENRSFDYLVREIFNAMCKKKCLVIIDDIWNITDWNILNHAFPFTQKNKILLTTRINEVANVGFSHHQRLLLEEEGLELLQKKALGRKDHSDPRVGDAFDKFGKEMVRKCGQLPLAISALGGVLKGVSSLKEWEVINNDIGSAINQGSDDIVSVQSAIFALSYYDLPYYLKPCFLYMGAFREDHKINPRHLYHMWIAEGMVSLESRISERETLMDVGERFLKELISRSMVEPEINPVLGRLESCRLHDMMRDLCLKIAKKEEFLEILDMDLRGGHSDDAYNVGDNNAPRLAIHLNMHTDDTRCVRPFHGVSSQSIRAISFHGMHNVVWRPSINSEMQVDIAEHSVETSLISDFKLLRVLDLEHCRFLVEEPLRGIGKLIHLRYLSLFGCMVEELPSSVGDLPLLQTLDLRTFNQMKMPHDIFSKKLSLRHLYFNNISSERMLQLSGLCELETLVLQYDIYDYLELKDLSKLVSIVYFKGQFNGWSRAVLPSIINQMGSWKKIKKLVLELYNVGEDTVSKVLLSTNVTDLILDNAFTAKPPTYESQFFQNLVNLDIIHCSNVKDGMMEFLGKCPNLQRFSLVSNIRSVEEIHFSETTFRQLRYLKLYGLDNLRRLKMGEGSLPSLVKLVIYWCDKLKIVPEDGLKYLPNLNELETTRMPKLEEKCWKHRHHYAQVSMKVPIDPLTSRTDAELSDGTDSMEEWM